MARARFGDLLFAQQVLHGDAVERGDMGEDEDARRAVAALPLGDGLIGVAELFRKTGLRVAVQLAVIGNGFGDELPQLFIGWWGMPANPCKSRTLLTVEPHSRADGVALQTAERDGSRR